MKKVLYITTISRTINAFLIPHIEKLIDEGYEVDCACNIDKEVDERLIKKGVEVYDIPFSRNPLNPKNIKAYKILAKIVKEKQYDIVHVHTPVASVYGRLLKLKFKNLKTIYTVHGFHFFKGAPKINWMIYYPIEKNHRRGQRTVYGNCGCSSTRDERMGMPRPDRRRGSRSCPGRRPACSA